MSMTGSEKICTILHRLGDAISCSLEGEGITEITDNISDNDHATPEGISFEPDLATAISWDNYHKTTSTLEGLHDTMGNVTQCTFSPTVRSEPAALADSIWGPKKKRRRSLSADKKELTPYRKQPFVRKFNFKVYDFVQPKNLLFSRQKDLYWVLTCMNNNEAPMWRGCNSLTTVNPLPVQHISYMENIQYPPTRLDVVRHTMLQSQNVREDCGEK